jgi:hypothetical protein
LASWVFPDNYPRSDPIRSDPGRPRGSCGCDDGLIPSLVNSTEQFHVEKGGARDPWHLIRRFARKVLAHTLGIFVNHLLRRPDLQFAGGSAA